MKTSEKRQMLINELSSRVGCMVENYKDHLFFVYRNVNNDIVAAYLRAGKTSKLSWHYRFKSPEQLKSHIDKEKRYIDNYIATQESYAIKTLEKKKSFIVGQILTSSWGYEQTNVDFYKIIERSGDTVTIQKVKSIITEESSYYSGKVIPFAEQTVGEPFRKRINKYGSITLTSYSNAYLWDGTPQYCSWRY